MAEEPRYKVKVLEDGQITVDAPLSAFPSDKKGYFTLFDAGAAAKGHEKGHSFHRFVDATPYTKEHFQLKKEEEHPEWTVLTAPSDKEGKVLPGRVYIPPTLGYDSETFARLKKEELAEIVANLTITPGLKIPQVPVTREPNLRSRMYREKYPDLEQNVVVLVKRIDVMGVYVSLLEYDETEGRQEIALVLRVDKEKGYIDLSKRRVSPEDVGEIEDKFNKSKAAHSIMRNLATTEKRDVLDLYESFGWELGDEFGHLLDAFKRLLVDATILDKFDMSADVKKALLKNVELRLTPQPVKVRSDFEVTCFAYEGIDAIKASLLKGIQCGTETNPIAVRLIAPPLYVMTCNTLDQEFGINLLTGALDKIKAEIEQRKGEINIKMAPTAVGAEEEAALAKAMEEAERANQEQDGDDDEDEDGDDE